MSTTAEDVDLSLEEVLDREPNIIAWFRYAVCSAPSGKPFCANQTWNIVRPHLEFLERKYGWSIAGQISSRLFDQLPDCEPGCACSKGRA